MKVNRFGLSRYIPEEIKREIRKNSKFGCVVPNCRNAFYEYEHLIPEFKDAEEHNPDNICLVCPNHQPRRQGKNKNENFSKEDLIKFYKLTKSSEFVPDIKNNDFFYGFKDSPTIILGKCSFNHIQSIININDTNVFSFQKNNSRNPFEPQITFNGIFNDSIGNKLFEIKNNEWISPTTHWDVITQNGMISIEDSTKRIVFRALKVPKENTIKILNLDLWYPPFNISVNKNEFTVTRFSDDKKTSISLTLDALFENGKCGIYLNKDKVFPMPIWAGFEIVGGKGFQLIGNGIWLGKGDGQTGIRIGNFEISGTGNIHSAKLIKKQKSVIPKPCEHYFVVGKLLIKEISFPTWKEKRYYLNSQKLENKPNSWGKINDNGEHLYYIASNESEDLTQNKGFIGFYADDILKYEWTDKVFEVEVRDFNNEGQEIILRVKRSQTNGREIISEINPHTGKYWHPQQFSGCSPWKKQS